MIEQSVSLASNGVVKVPGYEQLVRFGYTKNRGVYRLAVTTSGEWEGLTIRAFWHVPDGKDPASSLVVDGYVAVPASVTAQPGSGCVTFEGSDGTKTVTSADLRYRVSANSGTEDGTEPEPGTPAWQQLVDAVHTDAITAEQAKTDAQTAAQQAGASTKAAKTAANEAATSAGSASQSAQEAAGSLQELKNGIASGDFKGEPGNDGKSPVVTVTDIENGHRISITDKDGTKTIDVLNGQTGKTGATPVLTIGTVSSGDKPSADITGTPENPVLNLMLQPGPQGPAVALDTTLTHEGEAADAKATGDAISAVKARQNILVGAETGNPISVDDAFPAPLCGLTVYGRSTQDGTPTPDAPVPIVSAGDGGSVAVKVTGRNILDMRNSRESYTGSGVTYTRNADYSFTRTGTAADKTGNLWLAGGFNVAPLPDGSNVFCTLKMGAKYSITGCVLLTKTQAGVKSAKGTNFTPTEDMHITGVRNEEFEVGKTYNDIVYPAVYVGAKALLYEPYREQLLTLPTPNGLPGIPVTSGGNYIDQSGQQWVCDEVDLERGVKVQRIKTGVISSITKSPTEKEGFVQLSIWLGSISLGVGMGANAPTAFCNRALNVNQSEEYNPDFVTICTYGHKESVQIRFNAPTALYATSEEFSAALMGATYSYALATPIETPLTPAELAAYKALTADHSDTVVQAGDGAGIKLVYQRDVNIAIKRIEDAVASMT